MEFIYKIEDLLSPSMFILSIKGLFTFMEVPFGSSVYDIRIIPYFKNIYYSFSHKMIVILRINISIKVY